MPELESLEHSIRLERLRRNHRGLGAEETQLFEIINEPLPGGERLLELRAKREERTLSPVALDELVRLDHARQEVWARKLRAVSDLADHHGLYAMRFNKRLIGWRFEVRHISRIRHKSLINS